MVGDGPYKNEMQDLLQSENVEFIGYKESSELAEIYSEADLFVFPSTTDTFGNVVLEAQACGTPVIVTNMGGPMENIIPEETGIIVEGDNHEALFTGIKSMMDKEKLKYMGENARKYMNDRSFSNAFLKTWQIYQDAL